MRVDHIKRTLEILKSYMQYAEMKRKEIEESALPNYEVLNYYKGMREAYDRAIHQLELDLREE